MVTLFEYWKMASILLMFLVCSYFYFFKKQSTNELQLTHLSGLEKANDIIRNYSRSLGAEDRTLDSNNDVSFGASGFTFSKERNVLTGRVLINGALLTGAPDGELANYRKMVAALNDPKIGGLFDSAGGVFVLDEVRQGYYLTREFPISESTSELVIRDMNRIEDIAATWTIRWFFRVALIMHGHKPPPTKFITRDNDDQID